MKNYTITVNGVVYDVTVEETSGAVPAAASKAAPKAVHAPKAAPAPKAAASSEGKGKYRVEAGAAGKVFKIEASVGQTVQKGDAIVIVEAMKMEIPMVATVSGVVNTVFVSEGQPVEAGDKLLTIE